MDESVGRPLPAGLQGLNDGPARPTISTHVLDTGTGRPAEGIHVTLWRLDAEGKPGRMTQALTDGDGRVRDLLERPLVAGEYRLEFRVPDDRSPFFGRLAVDVRISDTARSYHVPLLLSPFGLSTYRGS
jgi:5-hydroxyisourate hydrolase